jgi:hypothetical protein
MTSIPNIPPIAIDRIKGKSNGKYLRECEMCQSAPRLFCGRSRRFVFRTGNPVVTAGWCDEHWPLMDGDVYVIPSEREVREIRDSIRG